MINVDFPELKTLPKTIERLRLERGLSKSEAATRIGADPSYIAKLEKSERMDIRLGTALALCELFGVSLTELLGGKKNSVPLIPCEQLTDKMLEAGEDAISTVLPYGKDDIRAIWRAMCEAAGQ